MDQRLRLGGALFALTRSTVAAGLLFASQVFANLTPIAVVDFTSSRSTPYRESLPELVVNELVNSGEFDVLEREKLTSIVGEIGFQNSSGFVSPEQAVQVGNMSGAKLIVTGHVLDHGQETQTYSGYGVTTRKTTYRLKARMEVIDVTTGSKLFSQVADATREVQAIQGQNYGNTERGLASQVAQKLVAAMLESKRIKMLVDGPPAVSIAVTSEPPEGDVEIDGIYYGMAGEPIELVPGNHQIKVSLPGYEDWEKTVMVREGTKVRARLRPAPPGEVNVKIE